MSKILLQSMFHGVVLSMCMTVFSVQAAEPQETPPLRNIPGITTDDMFPMGCISCHLNFTDKNMDTRLSTLLTHWTDKVEAPLLETAQKAAPPGVTLTGKHPAAQQSLEDIPAACLECHERASASAPSLSRIVHMTHLNGGEKNHYMTLFQGECTFCHKYNAVTGAWTVPSGKEQ